MQLYGTSLFVRKTLTGELKGLVSTLRSYFFKRSLPALLIAARQDDRRAHLRQTQRRRLAQA
jgi:hypothetical protein